MNAVLNQWIEEMREEHQITQSLEINEEAINNMVVYRMPHEDVNTYSKGELCEFLSAHLQFYRSKTSGIPMYYYAWFDEQAGQLRISAVSQKHNQLPFGCELQECELETLVKSVISRSSGLFTKEQRLKVWKECI